MTAKPVMLAVAGLLAACGTTQEPGQPFGAPAPDHGQMMFVDLDGCRWWVIGNATDRSWAPQTDESGSQVCDPQAAADGLPVPPDAELPEAESTLGEPVAVAEMPPAEPAPAPAADVTFVVQVASFAEETNAQAAMQNFASQGIPVSSGNEAGSDGLYRLDLGPFASSTEAESALVRARAEGFADAFVRRN